MQKTTAIVAAEHRLALRTGRLRRALNIRALVLVTVVATYGLIVLGGTVRATDSGTACPDWPLCYGQVVPPMETKVLIEYSHRLAASIVGFLVLGTAAWAWLRYRWDRLIVGAAVVSIVLLIVQVGVGAATVNTETAASVVALHLSIALTLLAALIVLLVRVFQSPPLQPSRPAPEATALPGLPLLAGATAAATFLLILSGAYVSQTGAGLAYPDWPLFDGKLVSAGGKLADLHYAHRLLAAGVGVLLLALTVRTWRAGPGPSGPVILSVAVMLYVAQVLFGAANIWFELATSVRIVHLALASALWGVLVFGLAWNYWQAPLPPGN